MIDHIENGGEIQIGKCGVNREGVFFNDHLVSWNDISYQQNYNRLTINSKANPNMYTNLRYTKVYNVDLLANYLDYKFGKLI